jgi:hypothetical protein
MRSIIKNILNEEVENLQNIYKGIDVTIKLLSKKFPFIVNWVLTEPLDKYNYSLYIDLIVDIDKVKDYYGLDMSDIYKKYAELMFDEKSGSNAYPFSALNYEGVFEDPYLESKKITETLNDIYEDIPDSLKYNSEDIKNTKILSIDGYRYAK